MARQSDLGGEPCPFTNEDLHYRLQMNIRFHTVCLNFSRFVILPSRRVLRFSRQKTSQWQAKEKRGSPLWTQPVAENDSVAAIFLKTHAKDRNYFSMNLLLLIQQLTDVEEEGRAAKFR